MSIIVHIQYRWFCAKTAILSFLKMSASRTCLSPGQGEKFTVLREWMWKKQLTAINWNWLSCQTLADNWGNSSTSKKKSTQLNWVLCEANHTWEMSNQHSTFQVWTECISPSSGQWTLYYKPENMTSTARESRRRQNQYDNTKQQLFKANTDTLAKMFILCTVCTQKNIVMPCFFPDLTTKAFLICQ